MNAPKMRPVAAIASRGIAPAEIKSKPPQLDWLDPRSLSIEDDYQRDLSEKSISQIRRIVAGWSWSKIKPVICVRAGNRLVVIDGQHTAIAAVTHGDIEKVPVMIVDAPTVRERAEAFISHNRDRLALTPMHMHFAALAAGDEYAVAVAEACGKAKVTILRAGRGTAGIYRVGETFAIGIITRLVKKKGVNASARVLKLLVEAKRAPVPAHEIAAVAELLFDEQYKDRFEPFDLITVIRSRSVEEWQAAAWKLVSTGLSRRQALAAAWFAALKKKGAVHA